METMSKELKTTIAMLSACLGVAFVALVALFVRTGGLDKLGTSVLLAVLVAFVAVGSAIIVDEYKSEQHARELRAMSYTLDAVRDMRDEYADTLAMVEADARDDRYNANRVSSQLANLQKNYDNMSDTLARVISERDELREELNELRHTFKAERERIADI